ncbi:MULTISPECIES: cation:proton antiporter family protein [Alteromonas]|jgi:predicted Kef-type K+ transport protein|uniref:Cation:proton antiporter n=1 Tax=Alteromonas stellipolaris TaxID=233316 RepID=A0AAW7YUI0_9ALTE|nr:MULTISPECIES: cation:proton antiporter family protein [Alteromonas]AMJ89935.1 potassium transporter Kef [Alteromonas sp. Mac2]ALM90576.1 Glutathione-regulated potassium-efflux system protein KefB [Alteromonas stellipolaris LMG 21856]AMJ73638.1 potassium transporter Kef [Alteromonas stellipolaris]AMJ86076.1 potassium transporter Kef [Alteromonas sp. Mac1]MDO6576025.1 cation:proton antiporter [Alteromonas stellipolaris]
MEYAFLLFAFVCGLTVKLIGIPPLVGYLVAGFLLNFSGYTLTGDLTKIANLGITIMLFTIGLKLNVRDLSKREVWAGSISHTLIWVGIVTCGVYGIAAVASQYIEGLTWQSATLIAFALSFSSTVCVIKVLEESGESKTRHGRLAIGILVMQDVFAVIFLVAATGKLPSVWALGLLALIPAMPLINRVINKSGHGELLPLTGFILALGGYHLFELVNIKGDLGALIFGIMLAQHEKASELAKSLLSFKDLFLIGFFLTIGLTALPDFNMIIIALVFCLFIPIKAALFFGLFTSLRLRGRTSYLSSLVLSNFSEFGLIVGALAVSLGLLAESWLVVIALSLSVSFVITSVLYRTSHSQYHKYKDTIKRYEKNRRLKEDIYPTLHKAEFLVLGMGRVGQGAFNALSKLADVSVWGMDADRVKVKQLASEGLNVICGDGEDVDLWDNLEIKNVHLILLALPSIQDAINITRQLRNAGYTGKVAAIARYEDEVNYLLEQGVDKVFNFFTEAGLGFAEESLAYANTQQE